MIGLQKFLFLFISKYRRKIETSFMSCAKIVFSKEKSRLTFISVLYYLLWLSLFLKFDEVHSIECGVVRSNDSSNSTTARVSDIVSNCINGDCVNGGCVCRKGWYGPSCQYCYGKVRVQGNSGWISEGPGNYTNNMKCSWLIESPSTESTSPSPIIIHIEEFATECGWDHLYIYDGDNAHAPLLGVFSGLLVQKNYSVLRLPEVVAKSGFAFLHFYTDVVYNLTGFNITYRMNSCPSLRSDLMCSGNGVCIDGICTCNANFKGDACEIQKCPNNCTNDTNQGTCNMEKHKCDCIDGFRGKEIRNDCSQIEKKGFWEVVEPGSDIPVGSASHCSVLVDDYLWVFGGSRLNLEPQESVLQRYDFKANSWETIYPKEKSSPPSLYGHSCVHFENKIYLYGGVYDGKFGNRHISNNVWSFDLNTKTWSEVTIRSGQCKKRMCGPLELSGHSSVVISEKGGKNRHSRMVVLAGHSPRYGFINVVQEFHFGSGTWNIFSTKGYPVGGSYGHSSNWDPITQKIYVYGGYRYEYDSVPLSEKMFSYDPFSHTWKMLESSPGGRFLHTSAMYKGLLYIFGGCAHNDTAYSLGSKCFSDEVLIYDTKCDLWSSMVPNVSIPADIARYGLSSVIYNESIYLYGGFNGVIQSDLIRYKPPACASFADQKDCQNSLSMGTKCAWDKSQKSCEDYPGNRDKDKPKELEKEKVSYLTDTCQNSKPDGKSSCSQFVTCSSCINNKYGCVWCGGQCQHSDCVDPRHKQLTAEECPVECGGWLHTCTLCSSEPNCTWQKKCSKVDTTARNATDRVSDVDHVTCDQSCTDYSSCTNCTANRCIWCNTLNTCVDKNAYFISFPFGQCMSWTEDTKMCYNKDPHSVATSVCDEVATCDTCLSLPSCGWCDDGSRKGLGRCMDGASRGPLVVNSTAVTVNWTLCPSKEWHFTDCPDCQCNGHSSCEENNKCQKCEGNTEGNHCEKCSSGFYGNALNGGQCKPCECNGQAETCHTETGKCFCTTKGVTGEDCGRCDTQSNYAGNPINGSCFYDLQIDYQFTFNLSKEADRHYTRINFRNSPTKPDIDADFHITCSILAKMNISYSKGGLPENEKILYHGMNCTTFKYRFAKSDYHFGGQENTTIYVYVYDFQPPLWIQISFSQSPKLDLLHFFITFSSCFLLLLLIAAVLWKIKQKYDMYRRRQRLFVEMEQMASRPFAQVYVEMGRHQNMSRLPTTRKRRKQWPSPIALEPCQGNRAAVLSLLVTLPNGGQPYSPAGQSGITLGSALVALGNPRKVSFEPITKTDGKNSKLRKSLPSHSLSTCI